MALNTQNLRVPTSEEAREIGRKGGIASGKARKERKKFKEDLLLALETYKGDKTIQELGIEAVLQKFMEGDLQAFTTVRDTIGEKPVDKAEVKQEVTTVTVKLEDDNE